jgi:putative NADH-flavin reductase
VRTHLLVLGGTGRVGRLVVARALARGYEVTVLARDAAKTRFESNVRVVEGNAVDPTAVHAAVAGQEAVVYALGAAGIGFTTLFSDSIRILIEEMHRHGVARLVAITGVGAGDTKGHGGFLYDRVLYPLFTRKIYQDKDRQEALIRASNLEWVIVRPAPFRARPDGPIQVVTDVRGVTLRAITPDDVAGFVVDQIDGNAYLRQTPFIGRP